MARTNRQTTDRKRLTPIKAMPERVRGGVDRLKIKITHGLDSPLNSFWSSNLIAYIFVKKWHLYNGPGAEPGKGLAIGNVVIAEAYQGMGVMRTLLDWMLDEAKRRGYDGFVVYTVNSTILADMLRRRGFTIGSNEREFIKRF